MPNTDNKESSVYAGDRSINTCCFKRSPFLSNPGGDAYEIVGT
ncbi:MAG TPA: hypothetical protein V6C91_19105 [Coleofasciculaceae cyanobacterium]